jgi:hypothetical protein
MMKAWRVVRWSALVLVALVLAVGLARLFSGPEDGWVRDSAGRWVAHGHPAGPPPVNQPAAEKVLPWVVLGALALGLGAAAVLSVRSRTTRAVLHRDLRFCGAVSVVSGVLAAVVLAGVAATLGTGVCCGPGELTNGTLFLLIALLGLSGFLALLSIHMHGTKRVLEAHYDLKRASDRLQEAIDRLEQSLPGPGAA